MKKTKKYIVSNNDEESVHQKFSMFRRLDTKHWNENKFLIGAILFSWIKLSCVLFGVISCYAALRIILRGRNISDIKDLNDSQITTDISIRRKIETVCKFCSTFIMWSFGIIVTEKKVDVDYSKYLGEDYLKNAKPAVHIANHTSWLDILLMMSKISPGFISRVEVKSFPIVGYVAQCLGSIFVDRTSKENRGYVLNLIKEKQQRIVAGHDHSNLLIFPEGTTSNTTGIMPFKQGPFVASLPVLPYVIKFDPIERLSLAMDVIEMLLHIFIILCTPIHYIELITLPVFVPNEYMYQNADPANRWVTYANTMREIMCEASQMKKIEGSYEMKTEYLNYLRKDKNK
jgi:1-acyl-sn-glycerol-3-phosphate acyltransferase